MIAQTPIDGVVPRLVVEPHSADELAKSLSSASDRQQSVLICGGCTKIGWGRTPTPIDVLMSTRHLNQIVAHEQADLTVTVQAGIRLVDLNGQLAGHGQRLPIESSFDAATVGGTIATNESGPLRHRYGTPRDLLIGIRVALTDGRLIKSGGNVVKNVAGYDLGKLMSGSFGSLAAIVSATFRLTPLPPASRTLVARFESPQELSSALSAIAASQLEAAACEVHALPYRLLLKFESTVASAEGDVARAGAMMGGADCEVLTGELEATFWREHTRSIWIAPGSSVRASWLPAALPHVLAWLDEPRRKTIELELMGRAAIGSGWVRIAGSEEDQSATITEMRARHDIFRHVVVMRAPASVKNAVDVWEPLGDAGVVGGAIKRALDPNGTLNVGRGPV